MSDSIKKIAVIGAGVMGSGIATYIAGLGLPVVLLDILPPENLTEEDKKQGLTEDHPAWRSRLAAEGKKLACHPKKGTSFTAETADYITVGNLEDDLELLRDCDWIIEVVAEKLSIKQDLMARISPYLIESALVTTNTSGISITEIAAGLPESLRARFMGTHFFNPPRFMRLLELIPGEETAPDTVDTLRDFCANRLGKGVVLAKDTPNFIANRIGNYTIPAIFRLMEKFSFDIETVDYLTGPLIGNPKSATFRLLDIVGLDVLAHVTDNLHETLSGREDSDYFVLPDHVRDMIANGQLGNKTKQGFYRKSEGATGKKQFSVWNPETKSYVDTKKISISEVDEILKIRRLKDRLRAITSLDMPAGNFVWTYLKSVLLYSARRQTEISHTYQDVDQAMRWGFNWGMGPFEIWSLLGFEETCLRMENEGEVLPEWIQTMREAEETFYQKDPDDGKFYNVHPVLKQENASAILDLGDGVLGFEILSPGNAISAALRRELVNAINSVEEDPQVRGLVLLNSDANFLTGANLAEIAGRIQEDTNDGLRAEMLDFHQTVLRLKYAKKPIVAAIHGMVLGGGVELSIQASAIVAHTETYMGLVEAGVGLIPAGGGIKELLMRTMDDLSSYGFPDPMPAITACWQRIAMAEVSKNAFHARKMGYLRRTDVIIAQIDSLTRRAKEEVLRLSADGFRQKVPTTVKVPGLTGRAYLEMIIDGMKDGGFISKHDALVAKISAEAITGGDVPKGTELREDDLLALERRGFEALCGEEKTLARIEAMLKTGKPLRN